MTSMLIAAAVSVATNLPTVVVEASRMGLTKSEIAAHVDVIDRAAIESSGARSTVDLLEKRANLFIRKTNGNPALTQISMRGYGANSFGRVKILVDGEELNNPDMSTPDLLRVPVESVRSVEILHGPQTVLHGGNASAGVINITTGSNAYEGKSVIEVHGGNLGQVGAHFGTRGGFEEEGLTYFGDFDYDRADGWRRNNWYEMFSGKGGVRQNFANGSWAGAKAYYANSCYGLPGGLYGDWKSRAREADDNASWARNDVYGIVADGEGVINDENSIRADFSFRNRHSTSYDYLNSDVYSYVGKLLYENTADVLGLGNRLNLGSDLQFDQLACDSFTVGTWGPSGGFNDYARFTGAVLARDEIWLHETFSAFGGARGEWFNSRCKADRRRSYGAYDTDAQTKSAAAGEVGANWRPIDGFKFFARWARFYHAPLADELISTYGAPNLNLKPEEGHSTEVGLDWTFLNDFNFNLTGYHMEIDDEIVYQRYQNVNAEDHTARDGFDTSLTWSRKKVGSAGLLYSYVWSRFTEGEFKGCDLPLVPRQHVRVFGEKYLLDWLAVSAGYRFVGSQRYETDFSNAAGSIPAYGIFDLGARAMPTWGFLDGFTFAFTIDNLLDRRYFDYGGYYGDYYVYPARGRSILFTVRYEF